ncbi:hypothetical protein B0H10DRAFT_886560 [Mycena sp. CBHHK59/15]|nr:hypothetical protein B0H10DRAFT_886560 [Mycena sp. CBHHK59/15]
MFSEHQGWMNEPVLQSDLSKINRRFLCNFNLLLSSSVTVPNLVCAHIPVQRTSNIPRVILCVGLPRGASTPYSCFKRTSNVTVMAAPQDKNLKNFEAERYSLCIPPIPVHHPTFSWPDADIVLQSLEGTRYRIDSYTLRTTSMLFKTMLTLPQPKNSPTPPEPIPIHQPDAVVEPLLCLMCGLPTPEWQCYDDLEAVLSLAENWDTPGPISFIRAELTSHQWLAADPLRLYALATHFGWAAEARLASQQTLSLNLFDPAHAAALGRLTASALIPLLRLHRARRDGLRALLDSPERFLAGNGEPFHCSACAITPLENHTWRLLKQRIFREMDVRPLGEVLGVAVGGMCEWPEAKACWEAKCTRVGCAAANYDRVATLKQIRVCVDSLPVAVDM